MKQPILTSEGLVLIISGLSSVGKTTIAYELVKGNSGFLRISELDIIREAIRDVVSDVGDSVLPEKRANFDDKYTPLFLSIKNNNLHMLKKQSTAMVNFVKTIVRRQQERKINSVIEGAFLVPSTFFKDNTPIEGFRNNVIFINLYLSDKEEHIIRRKAKNHDRNVFEPDNEVEDKVNKMRYGKGHAIHEETNKICKNNKHGCIKSIDISNMTKESAVETILDTVNKYLVG